MSCPHTPSTLLWLYGEDAGDGEDPAVHIATCPACQAVVAEHETVHTALGPSLGALRRRARGRRPTPAPLPLLGWAGAVGLAMAAAALLALGPAPAADPSPTPRRALSDGVALDLRLQAVEHEVLDLTLDLHTL